MNSLRTSVIIPVYNANQSIVSTLEAALRQSVPVDEIIIIDDASTDQSVNIINSFIKKNNASRTSIKLIKLEQNKGVSVARNIGIENAQFPIIIFCDADDQMHSSKNEIVLEFFHTHKDAIALINAYQYTITEQLVTSTKTNFKKQSLWKNILQNKGQGSSISIRQTNDLILFDETMRYTEDHDFTNRLAASNELYLTNLVLTKLGRAQGSSGGLSGELWEMRKGEIKAILNLRKIHFLWLLIIPFLIIFSLFKHLIKMVQ